MLLRKRALRKRGGFTLMEIIVVVAIILILAGAGALIIPSFLADANISRAKMDVKTIEKAVMAYRTNNSGQDPPDLMTLTKRQQHDNRAAYMEASMLKDPWGNDYSFDPGQRHPDTDMPLIMSNGPPNNPQPIRNWYD
jgi:general secretion pathway protein G